MYRFYIMIFRKYCDINNLSLERTSMIEINYIFSIYTTNRVAFYKSLNIFVFKY